MEQTIQLNSSDDDYLPVIAYKDTRSKILLALCRLYYYLQDLFIRFPRFTQEYYLQYIANVPEQNEEIIKEKQTWLKWTPANRTSGRLSAALKAVFSLVCLRYFVWIYYSMSSVDHKRPQSNVIKVGPNEHQFVCITTNCSRLSESNELADDLVQLPIFFICQPKLRWVQLNPFATFHKIGLMLGSMSVAFLLVVTIVGPLISAQMFAQVRLFTFVACPNITRRLEMQKIKQLCKRLKESYENYQLVLFQRNTTVHATVGVHLSPQIKYKRTRRIPIDPMDCLPINASNWWHRQLVSTAPLVSSLMFASILITVIMFQIYIRLLQLQYHSDQYLASYEYTNNPATKCTIWTNSDSGQQPVKLNEFPIEFNYLTGAECLLLSVISSLILSAVVDDIYRTNGDILVVIYELDFQLEMATKLGRLGGISSQGAHGRGATSGVGLFDAIRVKFCAHCNNSLGVLTIKPLQQSGQAHKRSKLNHKLACQEFALQLLQKFGNSTELYADLLDRIQIIYWNFARSLSQYDWPITCLLFFNFLVIFAFSAVSVYFSRRFVAFGWLPMTFNLTFMASFNAYVASVSRINSMARKLEPKMWSLVSMNAFESSNERANHSAHLYVKQLSLGGEGLAIKAFGLSVSYSRILEVSFWAGSIMLFVYARH